MGDEGAEDPGAAPAVQARIGQSVTVFGQVMPPNLTVIPPVQPQQQPAYAILPHGLPTSRSEATRPFMEYVNWRNVILVTAIGGALYGASSFVVKWIMGKVAGKPAEL